MPAWSLPESISDILPSEARKIEELRRRLLDRFRCYGYELVMPPLVEYTESLLSGTGRDMDLQMFKLIDQISGRTMGLRADITPQVARIDAHLLNRQGVTRLCYSGSVVHTLPSVLSASRETLQVGAEIYGHAGLEADLEVLEMLWGALKSIGLESARLDIGHIEILRAILDADAANAPIADALSPLLQSKDREGLIALTREAGSSSGAALAELCDLYGGAEVIERARTVLPRLARIDRALNELSTLVTSLASAQLTVDLADIRGYHYHSGVMFAAYCPGRAGAIARGGRYDKVGEAFGRARPAAGFTLYLRDAAAHLPARAPGSAIRAPYGHEPGLREAIAALRAQGEIVVQQLPGHEPEDQEFVCDRVLEQGAGQWRVVPLAR
jgi:ATP phosphoribosyltransferase regulatory subunit